MLVSIFDDLTKIFTRNNFFYLCNNKQHTEIETMRSRSYKKKSGSRRLHGGFLGLQLTGKAQENLANAKNALAEAKRKSSEALQNARGRVASGLASAQGSIQSGLASAQGAIDKAQKWNTDRRMSNLDKQQQQLAAWKSSKGMSGGRRNKSRLSSRKKSRKSHKKRRSSRKKSRKSHKKRRSSRKKSRKSHKKRRSSRKKSRKSHKKRRSSRKSKKSGRKH